MVAVQVDFESPVGRGACSVVFAIDQACPHFDMTAARLALVSRSFDV